MSLAEPLMNYVVHGSKLRCCKSSKNTLDVVPSEYPRRGVIPDKNDVVVEVWFVWSSLHAANIQLVQNENMNLILTLHGAAYVSARQCAKIGTYISHVPKSDVEFVYKCVRAQIKRNPYRAMVSCYRGRDTSEAMEHNGVFDHQGELASNETLLAIRGGLLLVR